MKIPSLILAATALVCAATAPAQIPGMPESDIAAWFAAGLKAQETTPPQTAGTDVTARPPHFPGKTIDISQIAEARAQVWAAWQAANAMADEEKLPAAPRPIAEADSGRLHIPASLEPNAVMSYYYGVKGEKPAEGYPLFLYIHGSGAPAREWSNGLYFAQTFRDGPSAYFVPRIPNTGDYYRWYQKGKQYVWQKLIRQTLANSTVDPARIYFFGISEGGYGSQRLASFYADYLAGAGPMAGGEPLANAPAENLGNIAFSFRTGDKDTGFYRNTLTRYTAEALDSLAALYPGRYVHNVELIPGKGHHIDYRPTTPWLSVFKRNPHPKSFIWEDFEMDGVRRAGFYNLQVLDRPDPEQRTRYTVAITGNNIAITADNITYTTTETDPHWGIAMKFARSYTPATSGRLRVYLDTDMVNLSKPVTVTVNGRRVFHGKVKPTVDAMLMSTALFGDPLRIFPAEVTVDIR